MSRLDTLRLLTPAARAPKLACMGDANRTQAGDGWEDFDVSFGDVIHKISDELLAARAERIESGKPAVFEVNSLDLEISFVVTRSRTGSGGIDFKVVRGDIGKTQSDQAVQRVTLHLTQTELGPGEQEFQDFDATTPVRPRRKF